MTFIMDKKYMQLKLLVKQNSISHYKPQLDSRKLWKNCAICLNAVNPDLVFVRISYLHKIQESITNI